MNQDVGAAVGEEVATGRRFAGVQTTVASTNSSTGVAAQRAVGRKSPAG
jgi:hypothetical protein